MTTNQQLSENNYIYLPNFIDSTEAKALAKEFKDFCKKQQSVGDSQVPESQSEYNYIGFLELLCEKTPEITKFLGEKVLPTYTYARVYKKGATLERHRDREACEISLTLHLDGDKDWPIYIQKPNGDEIKLSLKSGDAMMYQGIIADHWRDKYTGSDYVQVFMHYVRSRGDNAWAVFDKEKKKPDDWVKAESVEPEVKKLEAPNIITGLPNLDDYVIELENAIDLDLCNDILSEYNNAKDWAQTRIGNGEVDTKIRNVDSILLSARSVISNNPEVRTQLDARLFQAANNAIREYNKRFPDSVIE